jgi:predicted permease
MVKDHPDAYTPKADFRIDAVKLRDQITSSARTVLLALLAASALVFVIACSNVANLILARTVRREGELAIRAALGASSGALRRTLLAESLLLCGAGALLGILIARPMVSILAGYASRFSVRALDLKVDMSLLWVGALLAVVAAVLLAFVPRLPTAGATNLAAGTTRTTGSANRRLRVFAVTQIAASFMLLAGAGMLLKTLLALQAVHTGFDTHNVLALNVPVVSDSGVPQASERTLVFYREALRRIGQLPGVDRVAIGTTVPWRDAGNFGPGFELNGEGYTKPAGEDYPRARFRTISPGFFQALGVPIVAGRDFNDGDRKGSEPVVIISQTTANRLFPNGDALNRHVMWADPVMQFIGVNQGPRRIVGIAADIDDENIVPGPAMSVYHPFEQEIGGGRLFVHTSTDPYTLVPSITRIIRDLSYDQPVERAATLEDIRAEVLTPDRLNTLVFGGFAAVALAVAIVGVAGVLAFSVSGRTREFGIRLAIGSLPRHLLTGVLGEGLVMATGGVIAGGLFGLALAQVIRGYFQDMRMPGLVPIVGSAAILLVAAVIASLLPARRAARVDVIQALRGE